MSLLVKITLSAALILSIAVPFGAFAAGEKTKGRYKTALAANLFLFFGTMVFSAVVMFSGNAQAAEAGAHIIGINNRNLGTFEVDFTNALRLRRLVDRGTIFVAESGIRTPEDIELLAENQVDAVLVGETLMRAADKRQALRELKSRIR